MNHEQTAWRDIHADQIEIARLVKRIGFPSQKYLLVGSTGLFLQDAIHRKPTDIDVFSTDSTIWEFAQQISGVVELTEDGQQIIRVTLDNWEIEIFRTLPYFPRTKLKGIYDRAAWPYETPCMSISDILLWKFCLRLERSREKRKKTQDIRDILESLHNIFIGTLFKAELK